VPRLSPQATEELQIAQELLQQVQLADAHDTRQNPLITMTGTFSAALLYKLLKSGQQQDDRAKFIWGSHAAQRVQFFTWHLLNNRIQCKENLFKKKITSNSTCEVSSQGTETAAHIMLECPFAKVFSELIKVQTDNITSAPDIHKLPRPSYIPATHVNATLEEKE